jgi:hypothetical protein
MFAGCTSLTQSPVLPAPVLLAGSYSSMFDGCANLATITCLATNDIASNQTSFTNMWVRGVSSTGTFYKDPNMTSWPSGYNGIPYGWAVVDYTP